MTQQNAEAAREGKPRDDRAPPVKSDGDVWAVDFVHDPLALGTNLRILTIVDTFALFSPAVESRPRLCGSDVVQTLERVGKCYGLPKVIRVDQGSLLLTERPREAFHDRFHDVLEECSLSRADK